MNSLAAAGAALTLLATSSANAAVTYDFTALSSTPFNGETVTGSFEFTVSNFITAQTSIPVSHLTECSVTASLGPATCRDEKLLYDVFGSDETVSMGFKSAANIGTDVYYYFAPGSFEHFGTYDSIVLGAAQEGILKVSLSAVPEPSSFLMMATAMGLLGAAVRRSKAR